MDINVVSKKLENEFNCQFTGVFKYRNHQFVKAVEVLDWGIRYRYFEILKNNKIVEILDEVILKYFKSTYEIHTKENY